MYQYDTRSTIYRKTDLQIQEYGGCIREKMDLYHENNFLYSMW